jgi:hypothetical protein
MRTSGIAHALRRRWVVSVWWAEPHPNLHECNGDKRDPNSDSDAYIDVDHDYLAIEDDFFTLQHDEQLYLLLVNLFNRRVHRHYEHSPSASSSSARSSLTVTASLTTASALSTTFTPYPLPIGWRTVGDCVS